MEIPTTQAVQAHIEGFLGKPLINIHRQNRWRPTWYADAREADGSIAPLVIRGDRFDADSYPLSHEYTFHRLLEERGFKVPPLKGFTRIGDLDVFVMTRVPGKPKFDDVAAEDRDTVVDEYLQQLAGIHNLDTKPFIDAGITQPEKDLRGETLRKLERRLAEQVSPQPFGQFVYGWMKRHRPPEPTHLGPIIADTGQFHHEDGHLVTLIDLEFGVIGDPHVDLACWRMRDTLIPFGDMQKLYARYEELSGHKIDLDVIKWLHVSGGVGNALMFRPAVDAPQPETDIMTYMQWNSETDLMSSDFLCEFYGIEQPEVAIPQVADNRDQVTHRHLINSLMRVTSDDHNMQHTLRLSFRMARHLLRRSEIGAELDRQDVEDISQMLGKRVADRAQGVAELERFVLADADVGRHDKDLTILFHKMNLRTHMGLGPHGSTMTRHYECQRFDGQPSRIVQL